MFSCGALQSQHGAIGEPFIVKPDLPEVGVFTISLETPPKDSDLGLSPDDAWPQQQGSVDNVQSSVSSRGHHQDEAKLRFVTKYPVSLSQEGKVTPAGSGANKLDKYEQLKAPKKHNNRGRAEQLTRYIHKYDCEDFMEYAVDIHHWKVSLEEAFLPGDWTKVQYDITPGMRLALLEWMVTVTRTLEFSLETWCLAVNYLDRFLCIQLVGRDTLQLVGLTALWLAAKQEELVPPRPGAARDPGRRVLHRDQLPPHGAAHPHQAGAASGSAHPSLPPQPPDSCGGGEGLVRGPVAPHGRDRPG